MIGNDDTLVFRGLQRVDTVSANDRGLAYGDGLFETMRAHRGAVTWWDGHWTRLAHGAERLRLTLPVEHQVRSEAERLLAGRTAVLKLIVSRGDGGRGYVPDLEATPTWALSTRPLPSAPRQGGLHLRWCTTRLAIQPALAGLKHCNRLEQVLARAEWHDPAATDRDADEGLQCDSDGNVVSATAANLFILRDGHWQTPLLDRCGVAGVCRSWLLHETDAREIRLSIQDVESADAIVLCNAVRGILPVARLGAHAWPSHPAVAALQGRLAQAHPGFAIDAEIT